MRKQVLHKYYRVQTDYKRLFEQKARDIETILEDIETILENITDGFFAVDLEWNFTYINKEFEKILRRKRDDLIGKNIWTNFPQINELKFYKELHRVAEEQTRVHFEEFIPLFRKWFAVNAYTTRDGLAVYLRDITEEKKKLIKIQTQTEKLKEIAWIQSHQVRGPLASILGLVDLFNHELPTDPLNKEILDNIKIAANNLDTIIKEIVTKTNTMVDF